MLLVALIMMALLLAAWFVMTQPVTPTGQAENVAPVDPDRLEAHVRLLCETLSPRDFNHVANLDRVAAYIQGAFERAGGRVSEQAYPVGEHTYRNVIAQFGPETAEGIVVGAHYDTAGPFPGADDNASGVAGLIELAHLLGGAELPMQVELVAYTLEEPPFFRTRWMGSAVHAASLREQGVRVRLMISLEMIGFFSDAAGSQGFPLSPLRLFYPSEGDFIAVVGNLWQGAVVRRVKGAMRDATSLPVCSFNAPAFTPGVDLSDHLNYWKVGYPAVMLTDTAFYRNAAYHTAEDTPERLDYERMARVVQGIHAAILALAWGDGSP